MRLVVRGLVTVLLAAAGLLAAQRISAAFAGDTQPLDPPPVIMVAGTIRNVGAGWFVAQDATHHPLNLSVERSGRTIRIGYPTGVAVMTLIVTPDEQLARRGITAGVSAAPGHATITLSHYTSHGWKVVDANSITYPGSNIWILGYFERPPAPAP
jgi:hypothetical protein